MAYMIGNWVDENDKSKQILAIEPGYLATEKNDDGTFLLTGLGVFNPIPLTPEILKKCDFEEEVWNNGKYKEYKIALHNWRLIYSIVRGKFNYFIIQADGCYDEYGEYDLSEKCKYLHQLQNLYFALTGEELTVNLQIHGHG